MLMGMSGGFMRTASAQAVNCSQFKTHAAAQAHMAQYGTTALDRDRDGIACEALLGKRSAIRPTALGTPPLQTVNAAAYRVVNVGDGDTLRVSQGSSEPSITVRLACIDAPESSQGIYGQQATRRLQQLLPIGEAVNLTIHDTDRYGRTVAEVSRNGVNINLQMVAEGQAVVYYRYLASCSPTTQVQLRQAERLAQQARLGFWQQSRPILPQAYRHSRSGR